MAKKKNQKGQKRAHKVQQRNNPKKRKKQKNKQSQQLPARMKLNMVPFDFKPLESAITDDPDFERFLDFCEAGNLAGVRSILNDRYLDGQNAQGGTGLMRACNNNHIEIVQFLVTSGADVNIKTLTGNTAIMRAADRGNLEVVQYLLENNARTDFVNKNGFTMLEIVDQHMYHNRKPWFGPSSNYENIRELILDSNPDLLDSEEDFSPPITFGSMARPYMEFDGVKKGTWEIVSNGVLVMPPHDFEQCCKLTGGRLNSMFFFRFYTDHVEVSLSVEGIFNAVEINLSQTNLEELREKADRLN